VAPLVVPVVTDGVPDGTDNGPMACSHESLGGRGGFAIVYWVAVRNRQHMSAANTTSAFLLNLIIHILSQVIIKIHTRYPLLPHQIISSMQFAQANLIVMSLNHPSPYFLKPPMLFPYVSLCLSLTNAEGMPKPTKKIYIYISIS
jgi:hypothetical protein